MMSPREEDLAVLKALLVADLGDEEREAFEGMKAFLDENARAKLSGKQRAWARDRADKLELDWQDTSDRNRDVPRGREVAPLWNTNLPKKPPARRPT